MADIGSTLRWQILGAIKREQIDILFVIVAFYQMLRVVPNKQYITV